MKQLSSMIWVVLFLGNLSFATCERKVTVKIPCKKLRACTKPNECCNPTIIATLPYDITVPGYYVLKRDFTYDAALSTTPAISIDTSHVVLDLCSHSLSQSQANVTPGVNGIQINPSYNDIEIRNG